MPIFAHLVWARVYFLAILVKEMSNFGNSCKETEIFFQILIHRMQKFGKFCLENANSWHFDVEISLAKGIFFRKIGLANGAILKQWAAHPCPKFSREPPPPPCPWLNPWERPCPKCKAFISLLGRWTKTFLQKNCLISSCIKCSKRPHAFL